MEKPKNQEAYLAAPSPFPSDLPQALDPSIFAGLQDDAEQAGGPWSPDSSQEGAIAWTMFDSPSSDDNTITILLERENLRLTPSQSLVRIVSRDQNDGTARTYLGIVTKGPFAEPDGLRADAPLVVTTTIKGMVFTPQYHGRCQVELMGELVEGQLMPPRFRPLPKSPVWVLDEQETARYLRVEGDIQLGRASGHENIRVGIPSDRKAVLPRHTGILGTTGGGKSTTVARLIAGAQEAGYAVIVLDVEGEYTYLAEPTTDPAMLAALAKRDLKPKGLDKPYLLHLVGRETANPDYPLKRAFSLQFSNLSPYFLKEILDLNEAQETRFRRAYDWAKLLLRDLKIYPATQEEEQQAFNLDEFETGIPRLRLEHLIDVASFYLHQLRSGSAEKGKNRETEAGSEEEVKLYTPEFRANRNRLKDRIRKEGTDNEASWLALLGRLHRLRRLNVFDRETESGSKIAPLDYSRMLEPGRVYIVDLSDTDSPELNNLVITEILRGLQQEQDAAYERHEREGTPLTKVMIVIEEAHEFLSDSRIARMPLLFQQVARIAKRGRKRWLSLVFVTQLPQHLPRELLGLINNYILHKINDAATIATLQKTIAGIDESLWRRLPGLAPGQAICSFGHLARPLLVAIDPAPARLRMVD
ncbi:MAG TPA: ATP-binding protein [Chloroflexia bacterium]|nr:ATP-binding protein [Chloroflexia bacterium]